MNGGNDAFGKVCYCFFFIIFSYIEFGRHLFPEIMVNSNSWRSSNSKPCMSGEPNPNIA